MYIQKLTPFANEPSKVRVETRGFGDVCVFEGYLSRPEVDAENDLVLAEAWHGVDASKTSLLWQHKMDAPIGKWTEIQTRSDGLYGKGEINMGFELGRQAASLVQHDALSGLSVGFKSDRSRCVIKEMDVRGKRRKVRVIGKAELWECSLVSRPCLETARIAKSAELYNKLADVGLSQHEIEMITAHRESDEDKSLSADVTLAEFQELIAKADSLRDFEAVLRDARDMSRKERAAFIAANKALLDRLFLTRDAADDRDADIARDADADKAAKEAARTPDAAAKAAAEAEAKADEEVLAALKAAFGTAVADIKSLSH